MSAEVEFILAIAVNTAMVLNVILILQLLFGLNLCKRKSQYVVIGILFIVMNVILSLLLEEQVWVQTALIYVYMVVGAYLLSKGNVIRLAFFTVVAILLDIQWLDILELISRILQVADYTIVLEGEEHPVSYIYADFILLVILLCVLRFCEKKKKRIQLKMGETVFLFFFCIFSPAIKVVFEMMESTFQSRKYSLGWMVFVIVLNLAVFYGIIYRNHAKYYKELAENFKNQFDLEYAYFKDYKEKQKDMVKFRHDYHNHMLLLDAMLEKGEYEKAKEYFNDLTARGEKIGKRFLTGNEIIDIILNAKQEQFEENNIDVRCKGGLEPLHFLHDVDCCILCSNLIDNAIESNRKCEKGRHITIKSAQTQAAYMIEILNRTDGNIEMEGDFLKTTKTSNGQHGIGTRNAFEIVEKYQGEYKFYVREDDFVLQLMFFI